MGNMIIGKCKCGFKSEKIFAGGGMMNFETKCFAPALCRNCNRFLIANYLAKRPVCPQCRHKITFYNDPSLQAPIKKKTNSENDDGNVFEWHIFGPQGTFTLPSTKYLCPKCGQMTMRFINVGCWD